jgi:hypothetical protein
MFGAGAVAGAVALGGAGALADLLPGDSSSRLAAAVDVPPDDGRVDAPRPAASSVVSTRPSAPMGVLVAATAAALGFTFGGGATGTAPRPAVAPGRASPPRAPPA